MKQRILSLLIACLVLSSVVAPVGVAAADDGKLVHNCSAAEKLAIGITLGYATPLTDCKFGAPSVDPAEYEEAQQVHAELYANALTAKEGDEILNNSMSNYLQDTGTIAKIEAKNGFLRGYENGTVASKYEAMVAANRSIEDYYASKHKTVLDAWAAKSRSLQRIHSSASSEQNLSGGDVAVAYDPNGNLYGINNLSVYNTTVTLLNGSQYETQGFKFNFADGDSFEKLNPWNREGWDDWEHGFTKVYIPPADNPHGDQAIGSTTNQQGLDSSSVPIVEGYETEKVVNEIKSQAQSQKEVTAGSVKQMFSQLAAGAAAPSDYVDPYLGARDYDPSEAGNTWTTRSLTAMGISPPENVSNLDRMEIVDSEVPTTYTGVLMAQSDPPNASGYEIGVTYNASNIDGHVFVATNDGPRKLTGDFRIKSANMFDGSNYSQGDLIRYDRPSYSANNLSRYKELSEEIMTIRKNLEDREREIENRTVVAPPGDGSKSLVKLLAALIVALVAVGGYIYSQQNSAVKEMVNRR